MRAAWRNAMKKDMPFALIRTWWLLALRGLLALLFGLVLLGWRRITLGELVLLFGMYAFIDGVGAIGAAIRGAAGSRSGRPLLLEGLVSMGLGIIAWTSPWIPWVLLYLIGSWGVVTGVLETVAAAQAGDEPGSQWLLGLSGASSVLLGLLVIALPGASDREMVTVIAAYAIVFGVLLGASALRLRAWHPAIRPHTA